MIIIPIKWLFHWEYTQHFQTKPCALLIITDLYLPCPSLLSTAHGAGVEIWDFPLDQQPQKTRSRAPKSSRKCMETTVLFIPSHRNNHHHFFSASFVCVPPQIHSVLVQKTKDSDGFCMCRPSLQKPHPNGPSSARSKEKNAVLNHQIWW